MRYAAQVKRLPFLFLISVFAGWMSHDCWAQNLGDNQEQGNGPPAAHFAFDGGLENSANKPVKATAEGTLLFGKGLEKQALQIGIQNSVRHVIIKGQDLKLDVKQDLSVMFWIKTTMDSNQRAVLIAQKQTADNSLRSHKQKGWAFGIANGTWAWNLGSGRRRLTYERDNGQHMRLNDGRWHQLVMTYDSSSSIIRLYYDGVNWVTYNVKDDTGFDFSNDQPIVVGWTGTPAKADSVVSSIGEGQRQLQTLVDAFNQLELPTVKPEELVALVTGPDRLATRKLRALRSSGKAIADVSADKLRSISGLAGSLMRNPYTVHQSADFMQVAPLLKIYRLEDGKVRIDEKIAKAYSEKERLDSPEFDIDELSIWNRAIHQKEVLQAYTNHFQSALQAPKKKLKSLTAGSFNIHHGGIHETIEEDGWDSREAIAELIRRENIDVVMMQETYSHGDYIAAELGYYFATTVDWDYLNQGANISVLSRYPITEVTVPPSSPFMNVCGKVAISKTQDVYVMSNWYGMRDFPKVFAFHQSRFGQSDNVPTLFAGDFNAVPHTDGGNSPASITLLGAGFKDAYRNLYPDPKSHPGASHRGGRRIDQLYYKGAGLKNTSTKVFSTWPSKFPSDHYLIKSVFELNYKTTNEN